MTHPLAGGFRRGKGEKGRGGEEVLGGRRAEEEKDEGGRGCWGRSKASFSADVSGWETDR